MKPSKKPHFVVAVCGGCWAVMAVSGQVFTVAPVQAFSGRLSDQASAYISTSALGNYFTGIADFGPTGGPIEIRELRSYFAFNLGSLNFGSVVTAELNLRLGSINIGSASTATVGLFDVSTSATFLANPQPSSSAFADLGSGLSYGQVVIPSSFDASYPFALNAAGIAEINDAVGEGYFIIGARLLGVDGGTGIIPTQYVFGSTGSPTDYKLILTDAAGNRLEVVDGLISVPEPVDLAVVSAGLLSGFIPIRRWRQRH